MSIILKDRVLQLINTLGTGSLSSFTSVNGFQDFSILSDNSKVYYTLQELNDFEVGIGTYSGGSLSRDNILVSSNSNAHISLGGGATGFITYPADKAVFHDNNNTVKITGDLHTSGDVSITGSALITGNALTIFDDGDIGFGSNNLLLFKNTDGDTARFYWDTATIGDGNYGTLYLSHPSNTFEVVCTTMGINGWDITSDYIRPVGTVGFENNSIDVGKTGYYGISYGSASEPILMVTGDNQLNNYEYSFVQRKNDVLQTVLQVPSGSEDVVKLPSYGLSVTGLATFRTGIFDSINASNGKISGSQIYADNYYNGNGSNRIQMGSSDTTFYKAGRFIAGIKPNSDALSTASLGLSSTRWIDSHIISGTFYSGINLEDAIPPITTNILYNNGGTLYFNGSTIGSTYTAGTGLTLVGTEFNTAGQGVFDSLIVNGSISGTNGYFSDDVVIQGNTFGGTALTLSSNGSDQAAQISGGVYFPNILEIGKLNNLIRVMSGNSIAFTNASSYGDLFFPRDEALLSRVDIGHLGVTHQNGNSGAISTSTGNFNYININGDSNKTGISNPILYLTQTWNNATGTFTGVHIDIYDSGSYDALYVDNTSTMFSINKNDNPILQVQSKNNGSRGKLVIGNGAGNVQSYIGNSNGITTIGGSRVYFSSSDSQGNGYFLPNTSSNVSDVIANFQGTAWILHGSSVGTSWAGRIFAGPSSAGGHLVLKPAESTTGNLFIDSAQTHITGDVNMTSESSSSTALSVFGNVSQSANLTEWKSSSDDLLSNINNSGEYEISNPTTNNSEYFSINWSSRANTASLETLATTGTVRDLAISARNIFLYADNNRTIRFTPDNDTNKAWMFDANGDLIPYATPADGQLNIGQSPKRIGKIFLGEAGADLTSSFAPLDIYQRWNNTGVSFTGSYIEIVNNGSASDSKTLAIAVDGNLKNSFGTTGDIYVADGIPEDTSKKIYNNSGDLYFNGYHLGGQRHILNYIETSIDYTIPETGYGVIITGGSPTITLATGVFGQEQSIINDSTGTVVLTGAFNINNTDSLNLTSGNSALIVRSSTKYLIK